jgi:hypothetical protein
VFIAIVDFNTAPACRAAALAQLDSERDEVRAMPGTDTTSTHPDHHRDCLDRTVPPR